MNVYKVGLDIGSTTTKMVVLDKGKIAEEGTHHKLTAQKGMYYQLVKNQLELGS